MNRERPLLIYDGDCGFCKLWIERLRVMTGERVEYRASQEAAAEFPEVPVGEFDKSVQFIATDGARSSGARAVFRTLAAATWIGRVLLWLHAKVPPFAAVANGSYRLVAHHRMFFSRLTWLLWGRDATPPTYAIAAAVFLRLLGGIYLIAFVSFGMQARGLLGAHGILPAREFLPLVADSVGGDAWWRCPTLMWLWPDDGMLFVLTWAGSICALLVMAGMVQPLALLGAWAAYLSLVSVGQEFYPLQWDSLLIETGVLAIFIAPWRWRPNFSPRAPGRIAHFLLVWLLARLMFSSGFVKLASGDDVWRNLTALDFHYWTQPIPNAVAWFFAQAPAWFQKFSCVGMFAVELVLPFMVFLPRRLRLVACVGFLALQFLIALTGNYGFFNLLAIALAVLLVDDRSWRRIRTPQAMRIRWAKWVVPPFAAAYFLLSLVPLSAVLGKVESLPEWLLAAYGYAAPFDSVNRYRLFAVMTKERPEILLQGSMDGLMWETYEFKYKPGPLNRMPPFVAPYMPRLDWQMWFAALGDVRQAPWMGQFALRLFEADPDVLALLARDPFHGKPPRFLRAYMDNYRFTDSAQRRATGNWWRREEKGIYFPQIARERLVP
ncbi:MAG: lipase maturation factor family protein [Chthoniobacterales bacterium]